MPLLIMILWYAMVLSAKCKGEKHMRQLQLFAFDGNNYCDFTSSAAKAIAGKDILLAVWSTDGSKLLAISGQQGLTINQMCIRDRYNR